MKHHLFRSTTRLAIAAMSLTLIGCESSSEDSATGASDTESTSDIAVGDNDAASGDDGSASDGTEPTEPLDAPATLVTPATGASLGKAARNSAYVCAPPPLPPLKLVRPETPWITGDEVVVKDIPFVEGSVTWDSEFEVILTDTERRFKGNGLPNHVTGAFPVQSGTAAYDYYSALPASGYDSAAEIPIAAYDLDITVPRNPVYLETPQCIEEILTGVVTQTGATWHLDMAADAKFNLLDPIAGLPMDSCWGHPYSEQYHYHGYSWKCFPDQGEPQSHSPLFGYAIDGFGVFGPRGEGGKLLTNADLDECHGHIHEIEWDGEKKEMYHYHVNREYPYSIGCFRAKPVALPEQLQHVPGDMMGMKM